MLQCLQWSPDDSGHDIKTKNLAAGRESVKDCECSAVCQTGLPLTQ